MRPAKPDGSGMSLWEYALFLGVIARRCLRKENEELKKQNERINNQIKEINTLLHNTRYNKSITDTQIIELKNENSQLKVDNEIKSEEIGRFKKIFGSIYIRSK